MPKYLITFRYEQDTVRSADLEHSVHVEADNESIALDRARTKAAAEYPEIHIAKAWFWAIEREI